MLVTDILFFAVVGAGAGLLAGMMGIGGGVIYVPALLWFLETQSIDKNILPLVAVSTSLAVIFLSILVSGYTHWKAGNIKIQALPGLVAAGVIGAFSATLVLRYISADPFKIILSLFQLYLGYKICFGNNNNKEAGKGKGARFLLIGFIAGWISGFFGVGGGMIVMPLLHLSAGLSLPVAVGTATGFMIFSVGVSLLSYIVQGWGMNPEAVNLAGSFYLPAFYALLPTAFIFSRLGALMTTRVNAKKLKRGFGILIILLGVQGLVRGLLAFV